MAVRRGTKLTTILILLHQIKQDTRAAYIAWCRYLLLVPSMKRVRCGKVRDRSNQYKVEKRNFKFMLYR